MGRVSDRQTVINLRAKIEQLKVEHLKHLQEMRKAERKKVAKKVELAKREAKKKAKAELRPLIKVKRDYVREKVAGNVKERVNNRVKNSIDRIKIRTGLVYIDGVILFPIIRKFASENGIQPYDYCVFVLVNVMKEGSRIADFEIYGYSRKVVGGILADLMNKGYLERFGSPNKFVYTPSVKGRRLFLDFKKYYREAVTETIHHEKGRIQRHEWPVK